jgi:hypothetical protein
VYVSSQLCTDLAELHSEGSCAVQVSVVVHPSGWADSEDCRAYILQQHHPNAAHQQQAADSRQSYSPYSATLKQHGRGQLRFAAIAHHCEPKPFVQPSIPHILVLQERVSAFDQPTHLINLQCSHSPNIIRCDEAPAALTPAGPWCWWSPSLQVAHPAWQPSAAQEQLRPGCQSCW